MENKKLSFKELYQFKELLSDKEYSLLEKVKDNFTGSITEPEKRNIIIKDLIENNLSFETEALKKAMKHGISIQNTISSQNIISKVSDITSSENYSDFITFVREKGMEYYVIGDLHDDLKTFDQILKGINYENNFDKINLIFLGDYVDRGKDRLTLMNKIIFLKYLLPDNIHLLRGNHELYRVDDKGDYYSPMLGASPNGYHFDLLTFLLHSDNDQHKEIVKKNGIDKELIELYAQFFDSMPTVALFNFDEIKICAVHGGLPRPNLTTNGYFVSQEFESFNTLLADETVDSVGIKQKINMIWSDPYDGYPEGFRNSSDVRFSFCEKQFVDFCEKFDIDLFLRAHEVQENGYKSYCSDRLISVFSSGGRDMKSDDITNQHSYYKKVSPNFLVIDEKQVNSINIDFQSDVISLKEKVFQYEAIKENREYYKNTPIENKEIINIDIDSLESTPDVIQMIDLYNPMNKKVIVSKDTQYIFNHTELSQFYGIHKDICFEVNPKEKSIKNLANKSICIGEYGTLLNHDESTSISSKTIISIDNGFKLLLII